MHLGASTFFGINGSQVAAAKELKKLDFKHVELIYEKEDDFRLEARRQLRALHLNYTMHAPFLLFAPAHPSILEAQRSLNRLRASLYAAAELECSQVVIHAGDAMQAYSMVEKPPSRKNLLDQFITRVGPILEQDGLPKICIENVGDKGTELGHSPEEISYLQEHLGMGFCYDIAHAVMAAQDFSTLVPDEVHVTDSDGVQDLHLGVSEGILPIKQEISRLHTQGFDGLVVLECKHLEMFKRSRERLEVLPYLST